MSTNFTETKHWLRTARTLTEALPYMQRYAGRRFVIKYGGHAMVDAELAKLGLLPSSNASTERQSFATWCRS